MYSMIDILYIRLLLSEKLWISSTTAPNENKLLEYKGFYYLLL